MNRSSPCLSQGEVLLEGKAVIEKGGPSGILCNHCNQVGVGVWVDGPGAPGQAGCPAAEGRLRKFRCRWAQLAWLPGYLHS